ncbi:MAG: PadR family transcriptional regulator, partial [Fuerstiella sp.]
LWSPHELRGKPEKYTPRQDWHSCTLTVRRELEKRTERAVSPGAVYATLDRLENKGYVKSDKRKSGADRQGRARRIFRVEPSGLTTLRKTLECVERMREGLPELRGATC